MSDKNANPFLNADFSKFMDMSKMMNQYKTPNFDVESMMSTQRKNLEAMASTNQKAFEGLQSYFTKQTELARQSFEATTKMVQDVVSAPTPEEKVAKQVEATKANIETCVSSLKELSEILSDNQTQAMNVVSSAVFESIDGLQDMIKKNSNS